MLPEYSFLTAKLVADSIDLSPFAGLDDDAVKFGAKLIGAAYQFRAGTIGKVELLKMIGSKTYAGFDI